MSENSSAPASTTKRRTQEERSEQTKQRILETSARLIREKGIGGLRTADVAEAAGVSQGAQFHHFANKDALILATIEHIDAGLVRTAREHAAAFDLASDPIKAIIADARDFYFGDYFFIELGMGLSGANNKRLVQNASTDIRQARREIEDLWKARLRDLGVSADAAAVVLDLTFNMVRGFAVRSLLDPDTTRFEALYDAWRDIMSAFMAEHAVEGRPGGSAPWTPAKGYTP